MGIPEENLPHIFYPFYTTKTDNSKHGTGLGLTMAYDIIKDHGGTIEVESMKGRGTKFSLYIPVIDHLLEGDAMALDHRGTSAFLIRGIDPVLLLREFLGHPDGLCKGRGGHMHLFSKEHLAASSGIVGASGPAAVGFALASQHLRPKSISVAFFGEGAINQGMMMESMNLAAVRSVFINISCQ